MVLIACSFTSRVCSAGMVLTKKCRNVFLSGTKEWIQKYNTRKIEDEKIKVQSETFLNLFQKRTTFFATVSPLVAAKLMTIADSANIDKNGLRIVRNNLITGHPANTGEFDPLQPGSLHLINGFVSNICMLFPPNMCSICILFTPFV